MAIKTRNADSIGNAYVEYEVQHPDTLCHYYLIVEQNQIPYAGDTVVFSLDSFPPESTNVYIRVRDRIRGGIDKCLRKVNMRNGSGCDTWDSAPACSTGICVVTAGYADTTKPESTYQAVTAEKELTLEGMIATPLPSAQLWIFYCDQFFSLPPQMQEEHADTFAYLVNSAMHQSWATQVDTWQLGAPPCSLGVYFVYVNDNQHWYHGQKGAWAGDGVVRQIGLRSNLWYHDSIDSAYSTEAIRIKVAVAHEFYHGIQWDLSQDKWTDSTWRWFTEGQARFLPSAQYQTEEFLDKKHTFPDAANQYLTQHLNMSLVTLSMNDTLRGYPYCLFWRFMFEKFDSTGIADGVRFVRNCYAETVGTSNSIGRGKAAIDAALLQNGNVLPGWGNFCQVLDQFAVACYLNDDTSFHRWSPNPPGVYSRPGLTLDTAFRLGPDETDSYIKDESIPHSFGIDLMQVALDTIVDTVLVSFVRDTGTGRTLSARLVNVYPTGHAVRYRVEPPIQSLPDSSTTWQQYKLPTAGKERICLVVTRHDTLDNSGCVDTARFWVKRAVAVTELLPATDTLVAGAPFTQRAVVVNRGWMKESLYVRYRIDADTGTVWSDSQLVKFRPGHPDTVVFNQWTAKEGRYNVCCWVYLKSDSTRGDDTLHGFLEVLPDSGDFWRLDFDGTWNRDMAQPCADSGMQPGGGGRIRHQWVCCWHESRDTWPGNSTDYACLSWQESNKWTWDSMISPRINLAGCHSCSLFQSTYCTLVPQSGTTMRVLVSANDGLTWTVVCDSAQNRGHVTDSIIDISQWADGSTSVRIAWVYDGPVQKDKAWCVDDVEIRGSPARSCDVAVNGIAYPCGAITYGTPIVPRAYVVNHGVQSESLLVHMDIDGNSAQICASLAPHSDTLIELPSTWLAPDTYTMTCYVELLNDSDECRANDTATMSFSVVADTWMPKFPVYNGQGMGSGSCIAAVDTNRIFCSPAHGTKTTGYAFAKYLVVEDLWKTRRPTVNKFLAGSALAYPGSGDVIYAIRGNGYNTFLGYRLGDDAWETLQHVPKKLGRGSGLACLNADSVYVLVGNAGQLAYKFYRYDVGRDTWEKRTSTPGPIGKGGRLVSAEGRLYALAGGGTNDFYVYYPTLNHWDSLPPTPVPVNYGAALAHDSLTRMIYAFFGGYDTAFYAFHVGDKAWHQRRRAPAEVRGGACLTYCDHAVYGGVGIGGNHRFWRYSPPSGGFTASDGSGAELAAPAEVLPPTTAPVAGGRLDPGELLTYDPTDKHTPQYSPNGLWIAYTAEDSASEGIGLYRIPALGGMVDTLIPDSFSCEDPRWAHSGNWLVVVADDGLYKVSNGTPPMRLVDGIIAEPRVTQDDSWILYQEWDPSDRTHHAHKVRPVGTGDTCLTPGTGEYLEPQPISGSEFACVRLKGEVFQLSKSVGGQLSWLTSDYANNSSIDVSPDGLWLTYEKLDESGHWQVYRMRTDGTQETRITDGTCNCETPVFSPDGQFIAYTKWPDGSEYSQVCYRDTNSATAEVALNSPDAMRENPCWSPDCQYIIYELTTESGTPALGRKKQSKQIGRARTRIRHPDGIEGLSIIPRTFALYQNRPNPFGRRTTIRYTLPASSLTELSIYDVTGRTVTKLVQAEQKPGYYSIAWKGTDMRGRSVAAGTYFYVLKSNGKIAQKRMLLVR
ncbi:PD40 domain-containing protein [candidate division WOR-3 bacterium]|nr:PD40 domain-containing protein [candidate division WOR-3 bacterium]